MKDSLILEGKIYISAKRASRLTGYTTDYVGQLCRAGKLSARMMGHTWFVNEESLFKYNLEFGETRQDHGSGGNDAEAGEKYISTSEARVLSGYTSDYIGQLCRAGKLDCQRIGRAWFVKRKSLVAHRLSAGEKSGPVKAVRAEGSSEIVSGDDNVRQNISAQVIDEALPTKVIPGVPIVKSIRMEGNVTPAASDFFAASAVASTVSPVVEPTQIPTPLSVIVDDADVRTEPIVDLIALEKNNGEGVFTDHVRDVNSPVRVGALTSPYASSISTENVGSVASRYGYSKSQKITLAVLVCLFLAIAARLLYSPIVSLGRLAFLPASLSTVPSDSDSSGFGFAGWNGMAVTPAAAPSQDEQLKRKIRDSFSDEVTVSPDNSKTAGVITPVFRKTSDGRFVYVLVPVSDKGSAP